MCFENCCVCSCIICSKSIECIIKIKFENNPAHCLLLVLLFPPRKLCIKFSIWTDKVGLLLLKWAVFWRLHQQMSELNPSRAAVGLKKEISGYRKWVCRNHTFKLLPLWDFREVIIASDKLFGTEPNKIKASFPSSCLPINLPPFRPSSSRDLCWFVRFGSAEWRTSDYNCTNCQIMSENHK